MATINGVQYLSPNPYRGQAPSAMQSFRQGHATGTGIRDTIEQKRIKRELDKLLAGLKGDEPTRAQYAQLSRLMGPGEANNLLLFYDNLRKQESAKQAEELSRLSQMMGVSGNVYEMLLAVPQEQRPQRLQEITQFMQNTPGMAAQAKPALETIAQSLQRDGAITDEALQSGSTAAFVYGRFGDIRTHRQQVESQRAADRSAAEEAAAERARTDAAMAGQPGWVPGASTMDQWTEMRDANTAQYEAETERMGNVQQPATGGAQGLLQPNESPVDGAIRLKQQHGGTEEDWIHFLRYMEDHATGEFSEDPMTLARKLTNPRTGNPLDLGDYGGGSPDAVRPPGTMDLFNPQLQEAMLRPD